MWKSGFFLAALLLSLLSLSAGNQITVCAVNEEDSDPCSGISITEALQTLSSNTIVHLYPGEHYLTQFTFQKDLTNITFVGEDDVVVKCAESVGLAFFNVSNLSFWNISLQQCGLTGPNWDPILDALNNVFREDFLNYDFNLQPEVRAALFLGVCENVLIRDTTFTNITGIGLLGIGVMGSSLLENVRFADIKPLECIPGIVPLPGHQRWIAGGAYFLYGDYSKSYRHDFDQQNLLTLANCEFENNSDCSINGAIELYIEYSPALEQEGYNVGSGGGLSVILSQVNYSVNVFVMESVFQHNRAKFGAGAHITLFAGVTDTSVEFSDCTFDNNGLVPLTLDGGGIILLIDCTRPSELNGTFPFPDIVNGRNVSIRIVDSEFNSNIAYSGGGMHVYSQYAEQAIDSSLKVLVRNCFFGSNSAYGAAAIYLYEKKSFSFDPGLQAEISDTTFEGNDITFPVTRSFISQNVGGIVHIIGVNSVITGTVKFISNAASAIVGSRCTIHILGHALFDSNVGTFGGAMYLNDFSILILHQNSAATFRNNQAYVLGGAMFVEYVVNGDSFGDDCFLYFDAINAVYCPETIRGCTNFSDLNITIEFSGNTAAVGSILYGSTLESCTWAANLRQSPSYNTSLTLFQNFYRTYGNRTVFFDQEPVGTAFISTPSQRLDIHPNMRMSPVMPGQEFRVNVESLDRLSQPVSDGITSFAVGELNYSMASSRLGASGIWFLDGANVSYTPVTVVGRQNETVQVVLYSTNHDSSASGGFNITLIPCITGFVYNEVNLSCVCDPRLLDRNIQCNVNEQLFVVPQLIWMGPLGNTDALNDSESRNNDLVVEECVVNYCEIGEKDVVAGDFDSQCRQGYHHSGFLCGSCEEGYSVQFGSYRCQKCSHYYLFLVVFFAFAGIFLICVMSFLHITITEGYLNGVLFYSNIVILFAVEFNPSSRPPIIFIPAAFLSLNLGIEACFYDGMNALVHTSLQLVFVVYLFVLMGIITLLARRIKLGATYSPAKIFATLILLCYTSVLQVCVGLLSFVRIETLSGEYTLRWYIDPTVRYFEGAHGFLGFLAIMIVLFYIIPLPLVALFPRKLYQLKHANKLKPLYDAVWAPFQPQYRFWLGSRLILRWVLFAVAYLVTSPHNVFTLGIILLLLLFTQMKIRPFTGFWRNLIEDCLTANLLLLAMGALYFAARDDIGFSEDADNHVIYTAIITAFAYVVFAIVFVIHLVLRFPKLREVPAILRKLLKPDSDAKGSNDEIFPQTSTGGGSRQISFKGGHTENENDNSDSAHVICYTEFREPLLDEGELDVATTSRITLTRASDRDTTSSRYTTSGRL